MNNVRQRHKSPQADTDAHQRAATKEVITEEKDKKLAAPPHKKTTRKNICCSRRCITLTILCALLILLFVLLGVSYAVSQSPKELDEQWEDVLSYLQWWWATTRGQIPPCTYAGVRHYAWGGAVDDPSTCACELRRCPPKERSTAEKSTVAVHRGDVVVSPSKARTPTVESLWETCAAVHSPLTRDISVDPLRVFDGPTDAVTHGVLANVRVPMCVQSAHVYAALRSNSSLLTITYRTGAREFFYANLTDAVLTRGAKYHPITVVPAAGLLFSIEGQAGNLFTLIEEGLLGWSAIMTEGFGLGFTSEEDKREWHDVPRQVVFLSDKSMDIPQETRHSSLVARQLANAFTVPTETPFFSVAPLSRTRAGETAREPMYCFCGGFFIPPIGGVNLDGKVAGASYEYMRRTVNTHFGGAALGEADVAAAEAVRTSSSSNFYTPKVQAAWPPRTSESPRRPRLLWIRRKRSRIADEGTYVALATSVGFEVLEENTYVTEASAGQQFYLARYADVVAGFHGVSLINAVWMDSTTRPQCRTLVEFIPYANAQQVERVYGAAVTAAGVRHVMVEPVDLEFTGPAFNTPEEQETAKRELMGEGPNGKYVMGHPAFSKHRAVYDPATVEAQLRQLYQQIMECL